MLPAVLADVSHIKALRQVEVELNRRQLPRTTQRILDFQVDLGAIEGAAALIDFIVQPFDIDSALQRRLRLLPARRLARRLLRPRR